ncbi:MAG: hypothetical protein HYX29_09585 [Solirubrobacterales bacterium]|nr:hypothetical protein [Solirubrobacterales bacterium]
MRWVLIYVLAALIAVALSATASARTIDSVAVTPNVKVQSSVANPTSLPNSAVPLTLAVSNPNATLSTNGSIGYTGALFTNSVVKAWWVAVEYRGSGPTWIPLAGAGEAASGYSLTQPAPISVGLSAITTPSPTYGVTYPSSGGSVVGTQIAGLFSANWNLNLATEQAAAKILQLLSSSQTSEIRLRTRIEVAQTGLFGIQTRDSATTSSVFTQLLRSQSATATNLRLTVAGGGFSHLLASPAIPALASMPAGASASIATTVPIPAIAPKGASEADAAYLARLQVATAQSVTATTTAQFSAGGEARPWWLWPDELNPPATVGPGRTISAPSTASTVGLQVPVVELRKSGPARVAPGNSATYTITAKNVGDATATARASDQVDGQPSAAVSGIGQLLPGAESSGTHSFAIPANFQQDSIHDRASVSWADLRANTYGPVSADFTSTILRDTTPPSAPTLSLVPAALTSSTDARFEFNGEAGGTYRCSLDGAPQSVCASPASSTALGEGSHTFSVLQVDDAGNAGSSVAYAWTVDSVGPNAPALSGVPAALTSRNSASIVFSGEPGGMFYCRLDAAPFAPCSSPVNFANLPDGPHDLRVRQTDAAGNGGAVAEATWTVDSTAPAVPTVDVTPDLRTRDADAGFGFAGEPGGRFECSRDGAPYASCANPVSYLGLAEGEHIFRVRQIDGADNVGAASEYTWSIDQSAPGAPTLDATPAAHTQANTAEFTFSGEADGSFECSLGSEEFAACTSPVSYPTASEGAYIFEVRQLDDVGNTGSVTTYVWTIDRTPPAAPQLSGAPTGVTNSTGATIIFSGGEAGTFECNLDANLWQSCASPKELTSLADGDHSIAVRQIDAAGNLGDPASASWSVDRTPPDPPTITEKPSSTWPATYADFGFEGEPGSRFECSLDAEPFAPCESPITFEDLEEGSHIFKVRQLDDLGNASVPASYEWTIDFEANQCVAPNSRSKTITSLESLPGTGAAA